MNSMEPLVSILVANHNNSCYIVEALDSVINQTYSNIEIIIVDDASTDDSIKVIHEYIDRHKDKNISFYYTNCSFGCGRVKRKCADIASGKYFAFLDPDDAIAPGAIEKLVRVHEQSECYSIVYSTLYLCDENLQVRSIPSWIGAIPKGESNLTSKSSLILAFAMCRKDCYDKTLGINPEYVVAEDQDLYFKMEEIAPVHFFDEPLYYYRKHDHNMSLDNKRAVRNAYWIYKCKEAAYYRRKRANMPIPNLKIKDLFRLKLEYHIVNAESLRSEHQHWIGEMFKVLLYLPFSIRKGLRGMKKVILLK